MVEKDNIQFEDADSTNINYAQDKQTFRSIILSHFNNILKFACVEFHGGYWQMRPVMTDGYAVDIKTWVEDTREIYSNAVEALADALYPYFDGQMREAESSCEKENEENYLYYTKEVEIKKNGDTYKDRRFNKEIDQLNFRIQRQKINRKLFRALCDFLHRKKYLEVGTLED